MEVVFKGARSLATRESVLSRPELIGDSIAREKSGAPPVDVSLDAEVRRYCERGRGRLIPVRTRSRGRLRRSGFSRARFSLPGRDLG